MLLNGDHLAFGAERQPLHLAIDEGIKGVIAPDTNVLAGLVLGATLANQNRAREDFFAIVALDAEELRIAVAAVAGGPDRSEEYTSELQSH